MQPRNETGGVGTFEQWKNEHKAIERYAAGLEEWISTQSKMRALQFQQTVQKLLELNEQLQDHFTREGQICQHLKQIHQGCSLEANAVERQIARDHVCISTRLKHLIDRMQDAEFEMDGWKSCVHELGLILDCIEQHDEQEYESVCCLLSPSTP